jgi:malonyl CoA-acyl carrier protein transacylase
MRAAGVEVFVEVGPGDVLTKLMKRIDRDATALSTSTAEGYRNTLEELGC